MNAKTSVFAVCIEAILYLLLNNFNFHFHLILIFIELLVLVGTKPKSFLRWPPMVTNIFNIYSW